MTAPLQRVDGEFAVGRPIPWDDDDTLRDHLDRVIDALTEAEGVVEVDTEAEIDEGLVRLAIVLADPGEDAELVGRQRLAAAIRKCDGRHFQVLSATEEEELSQTLPSRSGLLTPLWRLRRLSIEPVQED